MAYGKTKCPVCQGKGSLTEDAQQYEFVTRDPQTSTCLICNGTGEVGTNKKLPNGKHVNSLRAAHREKLGLEEKRQDDASTLSKRLNVSKKALVPDTGVGYQGATHSEQRTVNSDQKEPYEAPMFLELALNPRLNKVLASGKMFLIVTETEPYYLDVYRMIRHQEQTQGTWTRADEQGYVEALEDRIKELDSCLRRNDDGKDTSIVRKEAING